MFELHTQSDKSGNHFFDTSYAYVPISYFNAPLDLVVRYCCIKSGVLGLSEVCSDKFGLKGVSKRNKTLETAILDEDIIILDSGTKSYLDDFEEEKADVIFEYDEKGSDKFEKSKEHEVISRIIKKASKITHFIATGKLDIHIKLKENLLRTFRESGIKQPTIDLLVEAMGSLGDYNIKDSGYTGEVMSLVKDEVCGVNYSPVVGESGETFSNIIDYIISD